MQFIVIAKDYKDALKRRLKVREQHLKHGDELIAQGKVLYGVAMLDDRGDMRGSIYIMEFPSRKDLDEWLMNEPYVVGKVWEKIEVIPGKVGPSFTK